jgi:hypothetical protein
VRRGVRIAEVAEVAEVAAELTQVVRQ